MSTARKLWVIGGVYVLEGFPMGVFQDVWPVYLRQSGVSLSMIGVVSGLYLLWSLKFLWSPLVDRFGERRQWIAGSLAVMAAAHVVVAAEDPTRLGALLFTALVAFCAASATQDVAIDAYTIGLVERGEEGPANGVRIAAYRLALVLGGAGLLALPDRIGWPATYRLAALASLGMALTAFLAPRVEVPAAARREILAPLRRWLGRPGTLALLAFVLLYRLGDRAMAPMVKPFWVDRGHSNDEIAFVSTTLGAAATVLGALAGSLGVARWGIPRALLRLGVLALASNLGYAAAAAFPAFGATGVYTASLFESFTSGLASAAFLSLLMRVCEKEHAAVQYAALTALYALPGSFAGMVSGRAVEAAGYAAYFALTAGLALPAFAFLRGARRFGDVR